jgi:hypothetical protein
VLLSFLLLLPLAASGGVKVTLSPAQAAVPINQTQDFIAVITGTSDKTVRWKLCDGNGQNCVTGGNSTIGTITEVGVNSAGNPIGHYTAPAGMASPPSCAQVPNGCQVTIMAKLTSVRRKKAKAPLTITNGPVAGVLERVSLATSGAQASNCPAAVTFDCNERPLLSADG